MKILDKIEMGLTLPKDDIGGLHFNETKVHAVFEKQEDGWYHSRGILFLPARNTEDNNIRDILTEYLNRPGDSGLKEQLAGYFSVHPRGIEISLPNKNEGAKKYNGANCWYWLLKKTDSPAYFYYISGSGYAYYTNASVAVGCAPAFCARQGTGNLRERANHI
jgi:hypothetical protein